MQKEGKEGKKGGGRRAPSFATDRDAVLAVLRGFLAYVEELPAGAEVEISAVLMRPKGDLNGMDRFRGVELSRGEARMQCGPYVAPRELYVVLHTLNRVDAREKAREWLAGQAELDAGLGLADTYRVNLN